MKQLRSGSVDARAIKIEVSGVHFALFCFVEVGRCIVNPAVFDVNTGFCACRVYVLFHNFDDAVFNHVARFVERGAHKTGLVLFTESIFGVDAGVSVYEIDIIPLSDNDAAVVFYGRRCVFIAFGNGLRLVRFTVAGGETRDKYDYQGN